MLPGGGLVGRRRGRPCAVAILIGGAFDGATATRHESADDRVSATVASHQAHLALLVLDFEFDQPVFMHQVEQRFEFANFHHVSGTSLPPLMYYAR